MRIDRVVLTVLVLAGTFGAASLDGTLVAGAQAQAAEPMFNGRQLGTGGAAYRSSCGRCHGEALEGRASHEEGIEAPALKGITFAAKWKGKSAAELYELIQKTMPEDKPGTAPAATVLGAVGVILQANGKVPTADGPEITVDDLAKIHL